MEVPAATDSLARALLAAGIPVARVSARDGYLETPWFDAATGRPASGRPLGPDRVRVRGWVSPSRHGHSELVVETVFRPFADPSATPRDLEQSVAYSHPVRQRVRTALSSVGALSTVEEPDALTLAERRARADSARKLTDRKTLLTAIDKPAEPDPEPGAAIADTTGAARDSARTPRDSLVLFAVDTVRPPPDSVAARDTAPTITSPAPTVLPPAETFSIQVAASADRAVVDFAATRLRELGFAPRIVTENGMMKVRTVRYATANAARAAQRRLRTTFPDAFMTRR